MHAFVGILLLGGRLAATLSWLLLLLGSFRNRRGTSAEPGWAAVGLLLLVFALEGHRTLLLVSEGDCQIFVIADLMCSGRSSSRVRRVVHARKTRGSGRSERGTTGGVFDSGTGQQIRRCTTWHSTPRCFVRQSRPLLHNTSLQVLFLHHARSDQYESDRRDLTQLGILTCCGVHLTVRGAVTLRSVLL